MTTSTEGRRRVRAALLVAVLVLLTIPAGLPVGPQPARAESSSVTVTKQVTRAHVNADGTETVVPPRTVNVTVSKTQQLAPRERVEVSWEGAEPSQLQDGIPLGAPVDNQSLEYAMVVIQCRGQDSAATPLDPRNCLTSRLQSRWVEEFNGDPGDPNLPYYGAPWTLDRYATAEQRTVNHPQTPPAGCADYPIGAATYLVPFVDAAGKTWNYCTRKDGTPDIPPDVAADGALPPNDQWLFSDGQGAGRTLFEVRTKSESASLGCSDVVKCSIVVVPIYGISCDLRLPSTTWQRSLCTTNGNFNFAEPFPEFGSEHENAVKGRFWWSPSNWRNRVSVPLDLAPPADFCDVADTRTPVDFYGSELLGEATLQWAPAFCLDKKKFKFRHQRTGEPRAKRLLDQKTAPAAFVSRPPLDAPVLPTVYAPAAVTGFAIGFSWREKTEPGEPQPYVTELKLTPRLLAKLITQSYPGQLGRTVTGFAGHPDVGKNPPSLAQDPEFQALNPKAANVDYEGTAALTAVSTDSDVVWELTRYINADPVARAWLDGSPDANGMVINPKFKGIELPVETLPVRDEWVVPQDNNFNDCAKFQATKYLNQMYNPLTSLGATGVAVLEEQPSALTNCVAGLPGGAPPEWKRLTRGQPTIALMSLADAEIFKLKAASLQTHPGSFVAPNQGTMRTATRILTENKATGTWSLNQGAIRTTEPGRNAYPGTMIVYTAAPTKELPKAIAANVAQFMRFSVTDGQVPGIGNGQLPEGYLPITAEGGLGFLVDQTMKAADAVQKQGAEPEPEPSDSPTPRPTTTNAPPPGGNGGNNPGVVPNGNPPGSTPNPTNAPTPSTNPTGGPTPNVRPTEGQEEATRALTSAATRGDRSLLAQWALPMLLLAGLVGGVLAPLVSAASRPGHPVRVAVGRALARFRT